EMLDDVMRAAERREDIDEAEHLHFEMFVSHRERHHPLVKASLTEDRFRILVDQVENLLATLLDLALQRTHGAILKPPFRFGKDDEQRFLEAIGKYFQVPVISIDAKRIDRQTLSLLPSRFVFQHHILPIETKEKSVVLATYDLFNSVGRQLASQLLKLPAEWVLVPRAQILRAMKTVYGVGAETFDEILKTNRSFENAQDIETSTDLDANDPEASVVKFVNQIIREAILERATDIHVEPLEDDLRIRYRIDGILHEVAVPPQLRLLQSAIISRLKVMAHMDIAERRLPQDGRINLQAHDQ